MATSALASDTASSTQIRRRLASVIVVTRGRLPWSERCRRSRTHGAAEGSARCLRLVHRGGGSRASAPPSLRGRAARDCTGGSVAACCQPRRMVLTALLLKQATPLLLLSIKISRLDALHRSALGKRQMRCARHHLLGVQLCIHATPDRHAATGRSRAVAVLLQPGWAVLAAVATGRRRQQSYANNQAVERAVVLAYLTIKISSKRDDVRGTVEVLTIGTSKARVTGCSISVMLRPTAVVPVE